MRELGTQNEFSVLRGSRGKQISCQEACRRPTRRFHASCCCSQGTACAKSRFDTSQVQLNISLQYMTHTFTDVAKLKDLWLLYSPVSLFAARHVEAKMMARQPPQQLLYLILEIFLSTRDSPLQQLDPRQLQREFSTLQYLSNEGECSVQLQSILSGGLVA